MVGVRIGVLALQGDFLEHQQMVQRLDVEARQVRLPQDLEGIQGLIIPGGESTTIGRLMVLYGLHQPIKTLATEGLPIYGTCAGMILLAQRALDGEPPLLGLMTIEVRRNAFGRQVDSFETNVHIPALGDSPFPAVFIRAPRIERVGDGVVVLGRLPDGEAVMAQQGNLLVSSFHPELTEDTRVHHYFLGIVRTWRRETALGPREKAPHLKET